MHSSENQKLLKDVIAEGDYRRFREELFDSTAKEFRRAHRKNSPTVWLALAAMIAFLTVLCVQFFSRGQKPHLASLSNIPATPRTTPLEIVRSRPIADSDVIRTVPSQALVVRTRITLPEISDAQLLAIFKDQGAGFVQDQGGRRFVLLNPKNMGTDPAEREKRLQ